MAITYKNVSNPQWLDAAQTSIVVNVEWSTVGKVDRSYFSLNQSEEHIKSLLTAVLAGEYGPIAAYVPPTPQQIYAKQVADANAERSRLMGLYVSPYSGDILVWNGLNNGQTQALQNYRTQLLEIENQPGYPANINWPIPPQFN